MYKHKPVLLSEVLEHLQPEPNQQFLDGTVGLGGHAEALLKRILPDGRLLAFDRDAGNLRVCQSRLASYGKAVVYINDSFSNAQTHAKAHGFTKIDGALLDLGFSSVHVDDPDRGFSFLKSGPLDMRYDPRGELSAAHIVNTWSEDELARIFREYGEERRARDIARMIVKRRKSKQFTGTVDVAESIAQVVRRHGRIHPATLVFQALRIAVNDEFGHLQLGLPSIADLLRPGGRLAVISFHSLEDRVIKNFIKSRNDLIKVNKKVITATRLEIKSNSRARSAKLRIAEKV